MNTKQKIEEVTSARSAVAAASRKVEELEKQRDEHAGKMQDVLNKTDAADRVAMEKAEQWLATAESKNKIITNSLSNAEKELVHAEERFFGVIPTLEELLEEITSKASREVEALKEGVAAKLLTLCLGNKVAALDLVTKLPYWEKYVIPRIRAVLHFQVRNEFNSGRGLEAADFVLAEMAKLNSSQKFFTEKF